MLTDVSILMMLILGLGTFGLGLVLGLKVSSKQTV